MLRFPTFLLLVTAIASCQQSSTQTGPVDWEAIEGTLTQVNEPAPPEESGQCVAHQDSRKYDSQVAEYQDYLAYIEAKKQGWRRLRDVVSVGFDRSSQRYESPTISIAEVRDGRLIDADGHHWLAMSSWNCMVPAANYYIDKDLNVFQVAPDPQCAKTQINGCGVFPTYGCGHDSPVEWQHYVRVPEQAVSSASRTVVIRPNICITIVPQDGYGPPPP